MAKLKLYNTIKGKMAERFKTRITLIGLSHSSDGAAETGVTLATAKGFLCGEKEIYEVKYDPANTVDIIVNNSIDNSPFLNFSVKSGEVPRKYHLLHKESENKYFRDVTISRNSPASKNYDSAYFIRTLNITFKGDGES